MKKIVFILLFLSTLSTWVWSKTIVVTNNGDSFSPNNITATIADTIDFQLALSHNVVEVSKTVWDANGSVSNGGFILPFGGGKLRITTIGTYYFVCEPHSTFGMKGTLTITEVGEKYVAKLSGMQEEFPIPGFGSGEVNATLIEDTLLLSGSFKNLTGDFNFNIAGGAHIHRGLAGTSGGIVINLVTSLDSTKKSGTFQEVNNRFILSAALKTQLAARELYVNIHTTTATGGEIRGQLLPASDAYYQTNLAGSQEVPPIITNAHGALVVELKGTTMIVTGSAKDLASGINTAVRMGGHFHLGYAGQNGGIQIELTPTVDTGNTSVRYLAANNTFTLTATQLTALRNQQFYANIHTNTYPSGEIRGQVTPMSTAKFRVMLSGAFEAVPVSTFASGGLILNLIDSTLTVSGSFTGLESNLAVNIQGGNHLHRGMAGQNGGIVQGLKSTLNADQRSGVFLADSNTYKLTPVLLDDLMSRRLYANIHSLNFTGGEIRGQVIPECQYVMFGFFSGMQENKPVQSTAKGNVITEVSGTRLTVTGYVERLLDKVNPNIGSHLHRAPTGTNGPIRIPLSMTFPTADSLSLIYPASTNTYSVTPAFLDSLKKRLIYANVHTRRVASGEARAQLNHEALAYYFTNFSGASENPPVNTKGSGSLFAEYTGGGTKNITVHGSFNGLEGKFNSAIAGGAHIHGGLSGTNGGIRQGLAVALAADSLSGVFLAENNVYNIGDGGLDSLRKRLFYANVHTTKVASGEIRGNFLALANAYFTANLNSRNEVQPNSGSGAGAVKAELLGDRLTVTGSFANLTGNFNRDVAGGAHLHNGAAGVNGGVLISLKTDTNADLKGGRFFADSNSVVLTAEQLALLNAGNLYVNIHSTTIPAGEIRGQLLFEPNGFPTAPTITKPISGDTITTDLRVKDTTYSIVWTAATDPDGNPLVYLIQTSIVPDFSVVLNTAFIGPNLSFSASLGAVDTTLALLGIFPGGSANLFFRVLASDGSLATNSAPISVVLRRGLNTPVLDEFVKSFSVNVYPVPAREFAMLEMNATRSNVLQLQILDMNGRLIHQEKLNVQNGHNQFPIDMKKLSAGMHILSMSQNGKQVASFKLIKE